MCVPCRHFQSSLCLGKVRRLPYRVVRVKCYTRVGYCLTGKPLTRLERNDRDEHFSLCSPLLATKSFVNIAPRFTNNLQVPVS
jgi:hypothetical protein